MVVSRWQTSPGNKRERQRQSDLPPTSTRFADISASEVAVSCAAGEIVVRLALPVHPGWMDRRRSERQARPRSSRWVVSEVSPNLATKLTPLVGRHDFDIAFFSFTLFLLSKTHCTIHIFSPNDPGNVFHVPLAGNSFVVIVSTLTNLERDQSCVPQERTQHDLFTFGKSALDVRPVAGIAKRLAALRRSGSDSNYCHTFAF